MIKDRTVEKYFPEWTSDPQAFVQDFEDYVRNLISQGRTVEYSIAAYLYSRHLDFQNRLTEAGPERSAVIAETGGFKFVETQIFDFAMKFHDTALFGVFPLAKLGQIECV